MPVTKSAKRALRVAARRHEENLTIKSKYKQALKVAKKAVEAGAAEASELFSKAQRALDVASKSKTIHKNKAARLKSRLSKKMSTTTAEATPAKKATAKKTTAKKK